jgi:hypothetical protein
MMAIIVDAADRGWFLIPPYMRFNGCVEESFGSSEGSCHSHSMFVAACCRYRDGISSSLEQYLVRRRLVNNQAVLDI